jgi:glycosyltransferase involved in cell wall biosynthesis
MNILHLSTYDSGGAAIAMFRLHSGFIQAGLNSRVVVLKKSTKHGHVTDLKIPIVLKIFYRVRYELIRRYLKRRTDPVYCFFNGGEELCVSSKHVLRSLPFKPDIIILHWVTGFITSFTIRELYEELKVPILWRFNDLSAFTGGCHYPNGCVRYEQDCGFCPALGSRSFMDLSQRNLAKRKSILGSIPLLFISSTSEIDNQVRKSAVGRLCSIEKILISGDGSTFKPAQNRRRLRAEMSLPNNRFIVLFGAQDILDPRKGYSRLKSCLENMRSQLSEEEASRILLIYATKSQGIPDASLPFETTRLAFAASNEDLVRLYQCADVFVSPSIQDAGPMMVLEALLCGVPVISYDIGLANDVIRNGVNGFSYPTTGPGDLDEGILRMLRLPDHSFHEFATNARELALTEFDVSRETAQYSYLFKTIKNDSESRKVCF